MERREVSSRANRSIRRFAAALARSAVTPNQISAFSAMISLLVPVGLLWIGGIVGCIVAVVGIQARLLANVLDGLVAIEGGKHSTLGSLYNEFPDRIADSIVLVSLGYAVSMHPLGVPLGWLAALLAALTAYVRAFGGALGQPQAFLGPMAKQHRMAGATVAIIVATCMPELAWHDDVLLVALVVIDLGCLWTCWARTRRIARLLAGATA